MNNMKTFFLMMVMSGLLVVIGFAIGGVPLLIVFLFLALAMNFFAYWSSDKIALKMAHAHPVTEGEDPELYSQHVVDDPIQDRIVPFLPLLRSPRFGHGFPPYQSYR